MITKKRLDVLVEALVGKEYTDVWWYSPNKAFNNQNPADVDINLVRDYLVWHCFCAGG